MSIYLVKSSMPESGTLDTLPPLDTLTIVEDTETESLRQKLADNEKIAIVAESSLAKIIPLLADKNPKKRALASFKDKFLFRELVRDSDYQIRKVRLEDISSLQVNRKSVIKPTKGFFGIAVKIVDEQSDFHQIEKEIREELQKSGVAFSGSVLSAEEFIVEDFVGGEEYAVDMFFNSKGEPCITGIFDHPEPDNKQYLHMLYSSSKEIFSKLYKPAKVFFEKLHKKVGVTNLPLHCEFKLYNGKLFPVEINPMRFGGVGLGNSTFYFFGVNPYQYFLEDKEPNWEEILSDVDENKRFVYLIAYNGCTKDKLTHYPNTERLKDTFTQVRLEKLFDYQKQLTFGVYCLEETPESFEKLLALDFDDYFEPIITKN